MSINGISIIIPTYNRSGLLKETLISLTNQAVSNDLFEVLVVDDGSSDDTKEVVSSFKNKFDIRYLFQEDKGFRVAKARNMGVSLAKYDICLFLDTGMIAPGNLVQAHFDKYSSNNIDVLIGFSYGFDEFEVKNEDILLEMYREHKAEHIFKILQQSDQFLDCRYKCLSSLDGGLKECLYPWFVFWTCHLSCRTSLLRKVNGFDELFTSWGGEDMELGIRLFSAGAKFDMLSSSIALHLPHEKSSESAIQSGQENLKYIIEKHRNIDSDILMMNWSQGILLSS